MPKFNFNKMQMKSIIITLILLVSYTIKGNSQIVISCDKLVKEVVQNATNIGGYSTLDLFRSDWLSKVDGYKYEGVIFVIAEVKRKNSLLYETDKYIFCGIPQKDWDSFAYPLSDIGLSIGEKFHKYIYDNKCNCY